MQYRRVHGWRVDPLVEAGEGDTTLGAEEPLLWTLPLALTMKLVMHAIRVCYSLPRCSRLLLVFASASSYRVGGTGVYHTVHTVSTCLDSWATIDNSDNSFPCLVGSRGS